MKIHQKHEIFDEKPLACEKMEKQGKIEGDWGRVIGLILP